MEFNFIPFGLSTGACTFQKAMIDTFGELDCVVSYFDDVLIFSNTWEEHMQLIKKVLETLRASLFTIRPSKTCVGCTSIDFLGHIISASHIKPDPAKTEKIRNLKVPSTEKEVRSILGLMNYYRRFVKNFSFLAQPLIELTKKTCPNKIRWTRECQIGLDKLKEALISELILRVPDLSKPFVSSVRRLKQSVRGRTLAGTRGIITPLLLRVKTSATQRDTLCNHRERNSLHSTNFQNTSSCDPFIIRLITNNCRS